MDIRPDHPRLKALDLSGFSLGETVLYCPKCSWQAPCHQGMRPVCPNCPTRLHYVKVDAELVALTQPAGATS